MIPRVNANEVPDANLAQSLHLLNSSEVQDKVGKDGARAKTLAADTDRNP